MKVLSPKYKVGNTVKFKQIINEKEIILTGEIFVVDRNGTFEDFNEVYYDIFAASYPGKEKILYKHISEAMIL